MSTTIRQFNIGNTYNNYQLEDLAKDGKYLLVFPKEKNIGQSLALLKKGGKLVASFLLTSLPGKNSKVFGYKRIY